MGIESDRRDRNAPEPNKVGGDSGDNGDKNKKNGEFGSLSGPKIDRTQERNKIADGDSGENRPTELKDMSGPKIDRAAEQQRNRDLWNKS